MFFSFRSRGDYKIEEKRSIAASDAHSKKEKKKKKAKTSEISSAASAGGVTKQQQIHFCLLSLSFAITLFYQNPTDSSHRPNESVDAAIIEMFHTPKIFNSNFHRKNQANFGNLYNPK